MPGWFAVILVCFGTLFFAFHLLLALTGMRHESSRDGKLEAMGKAVPGLAGLVMAVVPLLPRSPFLSVLKLLLLFLGVFVLIIGRAAYELIVFRAGHQAARREAMKQK